MGAKTLTVNGTDYRWPGHPVVVVCIDGGDPAYIEHGLSAGIIPNMARWMAEGFHTVAHGTMPSFTCPNNMSIVTGCPPSVHGISGNFFLNRHRDRVPPVGARHLRKLLSQPRDQRAGGDDGTRAARGALDHERVLP
jgi:phosphonoacetate hydrolase